MSQALNSAQTGMKAKLCVKWRCQRNDTNGSPGSRMKTSRSGPSAASRPAITLSTASGTFRNREYAVVVMQPYLAQDESGWVRAFFLPTTSPAGTFDGGDATGFQFTK